MDRIFIGFKLFLSLSILFFITNIFYAQEWQSSIVYYNGDKLVYISDSAGNRIPDFSYAGYKNGEAELPYVETVKIIEPVEGDNTEHIQNAINELARLPLNASGFRGALLLKAGVYRISGTIYLNESGIVLRGEGDGEDTTSNTIIYAVGNYPHQRSVIIAGGGNITRWADRVENSTTKIIDDYVFVGAFKFRVENPSLFKQGDNIIIYHPATDAWLDAVDRGGTASDPGWTIYDGINIVYNRYIEKIIGDTIFIDAPVFYTLNKNLSESYVYKYSREGIKTNIGIENLRVDIEANDLPTNSNGNENHAWQAIELMQIEDAWVKKCTAIHFGQSGFRTSTASRITIDSCKAIDPISRITGERRYNFNLYHASQLILVKNCYARYGRHDFVSNGTSTVSGCVFYNNVSEYTYSSSEGHRWWSQGLLYDNILFKSPNYSYVLALYNRGDKGTGHGWGAVNSVAWNCKVENSKNIIIQKPPTAQNYAIGCMAGKVSGLKVDGALFVQPEGYIEGTNREGLNPSSLYIAQLNERRNYTSVQSEKQTLPSEFNLNYNYPNPFNPSTIISYNLYEDNYVNVAVYSILGEKICALVDQFQKAGYYKIKFDANSFNLCSGVYLCRIIAGNNSKTIPMLLSK
jgi:hypothetical protein